MSACGSRVKSCPESVESFITNLYNNYVFNYGELDSIAVNFSPALLDSLHKAYWREYDGEFGPDDPGYAVWLFRTCASDGAQSLDSISVEGRDLYTAHITDAGTPCTCTMHITVQNGTPVLTGFKTQFTNSGQPVCRRILFPER